MFEELLQYSDVGFLILRLAVAVIFIYHALPKLKNAKGMSQAMGMPAGMIFMLGGIEFLSSLGMIFGIYVQIVAFLLAMVMVGAIYLKIATWRVPFGAMDKMGWEFDLILLAVNVFILMNGGGSIGIQ